MNYSQLLQQSHYLKIQARTLSDSIKNGNFKSLYRGQGIEMAAVRDYIRGDDVRSIDWNRTARMGRPFVKVFEEHRELQFFIIMDHSTSMQIQQPGNKNTKTKYETAVETAALLTFAAEINECPVGTVLFDGQINLALLPLWGREQTMNILSNMQKYNLREEPTLKLTQGSVLNSAINGAGKLLKKRSLVFIFSDFRTTGYEKNFAMLAHKNDVIAIRMKDANNDELPAAGTFTFEDAESGRKMILPSSSPRFIKAWKADCERREKNFSDLCLKHGIKCINMNATDEPLKILQDIFSRNQIK